MFCDRRKKKIEEMKKKKKLTKKNTFSLFFGFLSQPSLIFFCFLFFLFVSNFKMEKERFSSKYVHERSNERR